MSALRPIDPIHARRLIISKQHLDAAPRPDMLDVIRDLGCVQLDPIRKVERSHLLVLWSRLGQFDRAALENLRWQERQLFEYWAHAASLVLTEDYPIHAVYMRESPLSQKIDAWIEAHDLHDLRAHILKRLQEDGALGTNDFKSQQQTGETFSGWTNGRAVNRLMERMWTMGDVMVVERKGNQRKWDLAARFFPDWTPCEELETHQASLHSVQKAIKALGVARGKAHINYHYTRGRYWHFDDVLQQLLHDGRIEQVQIADWPGDWYLHADDVPLLEQIQKGAWQGKTTLLSPFDNLICDRQRTEAIFDFHFRIEIYVPKNKREFGYYVLPILHHEAIIGRMDMAYERKSKRLDVISTYAEGKAPPDAAKPIREALHELARFLGAEKIEFGETMPAVWRALHT